MRNKKVRMNAVERKHSVRKANIALKENELDLGLVGLTCNQASSKSFIALCDQVDDITGSSLLHDSVNKIFARCAVISRRNRVRVLKQFIADNS